MRTIKIKICEYNPKQSEFTYGRFLIDRLSQFYRVELSEKPDYVFFHESAKEHLKYPHAIRIFYTGENITPNFNMCDYAIAFDEMAFGDRYFRLPLYMVNTFYDSRDIQAAGDLSFEYVKPVTQKELSEKTGFCSFMYSNAFADPRRGELFDALSKYKKVNSGGKYRNNVGGPVAHKYPFEHAHKFSIAFENSSRTGYTTEKLPAALAAQTIPIYFGNPNIGKEFNTKRFINIHEYPDIDSVIERVKEIDADDTLYLSIINEPVLAKGHHYKDTLSAFDTFLQNIFDQPLNAAKRRTINAVHAEKSEQKEILFARKEYVISKFKNLLRPLRRLPFLNTLILKAKSNRIHR